MFFRALNMDRHTAQVPAPGSAADGGIAESGTFATEPKRDPERIEAAALRRIAVRGGAYVIASRLVIQLFSWVVTIETARLLLPYDYGVLSATTIFSNLADILASGGVGKALVQKPVVDDDDLAASFTFNLMLSSIIYLVLCVCAGAAARAVRTPELVLALPVVGLVLLLIPFRAVPFAILERRLQLKRMATIGVLSTIIQGCLVLALAFSGWGYWALIVGYMVPIFLEVPVLAWQARWLPRLRWPGGWSNPLVSFGAQYTGGRFCSFVYRSADYAVVGRLLGPIALGYYSLAFMLISLPVEKIVGTCNVVAFPIFCRLADDRERIRDWYLRLGILFGFLAAPALVGLALVADDAILVVLGAKWGPAVLPLRIMSLAGIMMVLGNTIEILFNAVGRPDVNFRFTAISVAVFAPLFYLSAYWLGITGVALVWLICYPIMILFLFGSTRSITGIGVRDIIDSQLPIWASVVFMGLLVLATRYFLRDFRAVPVRLGISILVGACGYAAAIRVLAWESVMGNVRLTWRELRSPKVVLDGA